jgi:hypothetical protein
MQGQPLARLTLTVTVVEENGELFWETATATKSLQQVDVRSYEFQLAQNGIWALEEFRDQERES